MKILTICPSIHPEKLSKMYDSYDATTSKHNKLVVINKKGTITNIINETFNKYPDFDFYHVTNDDVIYEMPLWDMSLANKNKISHGKDAIPSGFDGQFFMIDGDIVRTLGWLQMPTLNRYCGDMVWRFIGKQLNILEYKENVIIKHNWEGCEDIETHKNDMSKFAEWLQGSHIEINKIREIMI